MSYLLLCHPERHFRNLRNLVSFSKHPFAPPQNLVSISKPIFANRDICFQNRLGVLLHFLVALENAHHLAAEIKAAQIAGVDEKAH